MAPIHCCPEGERLLARWSELAAAWSRASGAEATALAQAMARAAALYDAHLAACRARLTQLSPRQQARVRFIRWLVESGRLEHGPDEGARAYPELAAQHADPRGGAR